MTHLTDTEREALHEAVDIAENCTCCGTDYGWTHVYADVERIVTARLAEQREALAAAIEAEARRWGDGTRATYAVRKAARIVREWQPGEDG